MVTYHVSRGRPFISWTPKADWRSEWLSRLNRIGRSTGIFQVVIEKVHLWILHFTFLQWVIPYKLYACSNIRSFSKFDRKLKDILVDPIAGLSEVWLPKNLGHWIGRFLASPAWNYSGLYRTSDWPLRTASTLSACFARICFLTNSGPLNFFPLNGHKYFSGASCWVLTSMNFFTSSSSSFLPKAAVSSSP